MSQRDVGDWIIPTLTVDPADATTVATVVVIDPDGAEVDPGAATTDDGGATWTAPAYEVTGPGEWVERWTVTGTGASVQRRQVLVAPDPVDAGLSGTRIYATTGDYANYLRTAPPADSRRALAEASRDVDRMLLTAVYDTDDDDMPTDSDVADALRDATCMQADYRRGTGDPTGRDAGRITQGRIGSVQVTRTGPRGAAAPSRYSAKARERLAEAGLIGYGPWGW